MFVKCVMQVVVKVVESYFALWTFELSLLFCGLLFSIPLMERIVLFFRVQAYEIYIPRLSRLAYLGVVHLTHGVPLGVILAAVRVERKQIVRPC